MIILAEEKHCQVKTPDKGRESKNLDKITVLTRFKQQIL